MTGWRTFFARMAGDAEGAALAEFAMVLPLFLVLVCGLVDGARLINDSLEVHAAAQAGASWARKYGWDPAGIAQEVATATPAGASADPAPSLSFGCLQGQAITAPDAQGACPNGQPPGGFVFISAQAPFAPQAPLPALIWPAKLTAQAMVRIQ